MSNFNQQMRRAINPTNTLENRRRGLGDCLRKIAMRTWPGSVWVNYEFADHNQSVRSRYNLQFGFDDEPADLDRVTLAALAAQVEYNQLRERRQEGERQQIRQKARGIRNGTKAEHQAIRKRFEEMWKRRDEEKQKPHQSE